MSEGLIKLGALAAHRLLVSGELTSVELVDAAARRIAIVEPAVNALPTLCLERARAQAKSADRARRAGEKTLLGGLPIVVKDNNDVGGVRTTGGTPIFKTRIAEVSDRTIAKLESNGAIVLGKSNLSELGGAQTTNAVHGTTRNPYDTRLTCGGSSGGAAVALATGETWLAHGNDLGGSLRIPAAFCNVTGLRPTPGRVPRKRLANPFDTMAVEGPMARDVADLAFMFDAMVGFDPGDPLTSPNSEPPFLDAAASPHKPDRLAMSVDLGELPISDDIRIAMAELMRLFERAGITVATDLPDVAGAMDAFLALRGSSFLAAWDPFMAEHRSLFPKPVMEDIERGRHQSGVALAAAERYRGRAVPPYHRLSRYAPLPGLSCDAGYAVSSRDSFPDRTRRAQAVDVRRLDLDHGDLVADRLPGDFSSGRLLEGRPADRHPNSRPSTSRGRSLSSCRLDRARNCACLVSRSIRDARRRHSQGRWRFDCNTGYR